MIGRPQSSTAACVLLVVLLGCGLALTAGTAAAGTGTDALEPTTEAGFASSTTGGSTTADAIAGSDSTTSSPDPIVETTTYRLLPDESTHVEAELRYEIPDGVDHLAFRIRRGSYDVVGTDGFEETSDGFEWDGQSDVASVTIRHHVEESFHPQAVDDHYVGGGEGWALVARPQTEIEWRFFGGEPGVEYEMAVDGEGATGQRLAYLGPHEAHSTTVDGETLTLVVPGAADTTSSPDAILDSLEHASDRLRVGNRNDEVLVVAVPSDAADWSPPGLSLTADARVVDDAPVDGDVNVWVHEYVHTRQYRDHFDPNADAVDDDARWLVEGTADYYAALINLELGHLDFEAFQAVLERGSQAPAADVVLADRSTWDDTEADYQKGALVAGAIDHQIRVASDGDHTLQDVVREWNRAETFTADDLEAAAAEYGDESVREFVREYTRTDAAPSTWSEAEHRAYFETDLAQFDYSLDAEPRVTGPYRSTDLTGAVVVGETVAADVRVENVGDVAGSYLAVLAIGGERVDATTARLEPGGTDTVELAHTVEEPGSYTMSVGDGTSRELRVREPAEPHVTEFSIASDAPPAGHSIPVTATVENDAAVPASGEVEVLVGGEVVDSTSVGLAPGESATVELSAVFDHPGEHEVVVGGASLTVDAREATPLDRLPGFGIAAAAIAVLVGAGLLARRR